MIHNEFHLTFTNYFLVYCWGGSQNLHLFNSSRPLLIKRCNGRDMAELIFFMLTRRFALRFAFPLAFKTIEAYSYVDCSRNRRTFPLFNLLIVRLVRAGNSIRSRRTLSEVRNTRISSSRSRTGGDCAGFPLFVVSYWLGIVNRRRLLAGEACVWQKELHEMNLYLSKCTRCRDDKNRL